MKKQIKGSGLKYVWQKIDPAHRKLIIGLAIVASLAPISLAVIALGSWCVDQWNQFAKLFTPYL